jgi:hypothetical protein
MPLLTDWPSLPLTPNVPDRLRSSTKVEDRRGSGKPARPRGRFKCHEPECRRRRAYQSLSGLTVHRRAAHGFISDSKWAVQKREVRARKRDPENAPPRRKPGPPPGTPKNRLCLRCRSDMRAVASAPPAVVLPFGDVEFIRKRVVWLIDRATERLMVELAAPDAHVREAIWSVLENKLAAPRMARRSVNPAAAFGTTGGSALSWQP